MGHKEASRPHTAPSPIPPTAVHHPKTASSFLERQCFQHNARRLTSVNWYVTMSQAVSREFWVLELERSTRFLVICTESRGEAIVSEVWEAANTQERTRKDAKGLWLLSLIHPIRSPQPSGKNRRPLTMVSPRPYLWMRRNASTLILVTTLFRKPA